MGSTEQSAAASGGFSAARRRSGRRHRTRWTLSGLLSRLSPVSLAISLTAIAACVAFVAVDLQRTLEEAAARVDLVAQAMAAELAAADPGDPATLLGRLEASLPRGFTARLEPISAAAAPIAMASALPQQGNDSLVAERALAHNAGKLSVAFDQIEALRGAWTRAAMAGGATLLLVLASLRRRRQQPGGEALDALLAAVPFGVACWNASGTLVASNDSYRQRHAEVGAPNGPGSYHETLKRWAAGGYMRVVNKARDSRVIELHRPDGSCLKIEEQPMAAGGFVTLVTDITAEKETDLLLSTVRDEQRKLARRYHEEKLRAEAASRSKTSFLAHLSHDIRTPLNHIIGFADLITHQTYGPLGDARYLEYVDSIRHSGEKLLASFAEILDLAELESGEKVLRSDPVAVDELIEATAARFAPQATRAGLSVAIGAPTGAVLMGDQFGLMRMLGNLMDNAIRFTPAGGKIALAAFAASDGIVIEVSDTGIGMSEERLASLSQPFVVGDATFTRKQGGAGLGIAIARAIAELSGGHLAIDSSPALGTTVAISLPMRGAEAEQIEAA